MRINTLGKRIARPFVKRGMAFVNSRPGLRRRCVTLARNFGVYDSIRAIYSRISWHTHPVSSMMGPKINALHLSPHARHIYTDLNAAISSRQKVSK
jgi:hypothetical protein